VRPAVKRSNFKAHFIAEKQFAEHSRNVAVCEALNRAKAERRIICFESGDRYANVELNANCLRMRGCQGK
jgi:hypothetical protein